MRELSVIEELPKEELSKEEIEYLIKYYKFLSNRYTNFEQAVKRSTNSIYGAFGNKWFHFFDVDIAQSITAQGKDAILYAEKVINKYFNEFFHKDKEVHEHFNIKVNKQLQQPAVIYIDTDSVDGKSELVVNNYRIKIEDFWSQCSKINGYDVDERGNEITYPDSNTQILNWTEDKGLNNIPVKRVIRHKVKKKKWKVKTKSGKEVVITDDHSIMVKRNGQLIKLRASEIDVQKDKIVSIYKTKK